MPINLPPYYEDPYYGQTQKQLAKLGGQLLTGEVPEFYKPLAEIGGGPFEDVLRGIRTDIERGVTAQAARLGQRGGAPLETIGRELARVTPSLRWQEMLRGIGSRRGLLGLGTQLLTGVRGAGLTAGAGRRGFELSSAQLAMNREQFTASLEEERRRFNEELGFRRERGEISDEQFSQEMALKEKQLNLQAQMWQEQKAISEAQAKGQMWSSIISGGLGALGTIGGAMIGGPLGVAAGGTILGGVGGKTITSPNIPGGTAWSPYLNW